MDVYFYEAFAEEVEALMRYLPPQVRAGFCPDTIQESRHDRPPARLISIRTQSVIPKDWGAEVTGILTRSTGFDHLKTFLGACTNPVACGYLPLYCSRSVAEQAMLLWMSLLRRLPRQVHNFRTFNRDGLTGHECLGKVLLVVGVGNIGSEICRIGRALGMEVLGVDIVQRHLDIPYVSIEEGLRRASVVVCAMNLTEDNRGYFHTGLLKKAQPGLIFVNIARGELSPSQDLLQLLDENHLLGVGLDVYANESELAVCLRTGRKSEDREVQATLQLSTRSAVILTPHNAFNTAEALERKAGQSIEQIEHFLANKSFIWPVPSAMNGE